MHSYRLKLCLCFLLSAGAAIPAHADIVGGDEVRPADPIRGSTAALYQPSAKGPGGALCTASLIGNDIALTAAHCVQKGGPRPMLIFGRNLRDPGAEKRQVTASEVNSSWATHQGRGMDQGDIALVKFRGGLPEGYQATDPLVATDTLRKGQRAVLAGYGITDAATQTGAGVLRKTSVKVADPRRGRSEMIFDQSHGKGACHGDSGGPAYIRQGGREVLAGVTNRSYPDGAPDDCKHKVVYTKVSAYRPWIQKEEAALRAGEGQLKARATGARSRTRAKAGTMARSSSRSPRGRDHGHPRHSRRAMS